MTELRIEKLSIPAANMGKESSLPMVGNSIRSYFRRDEFALGESDGLFLGYGAVESALPYRSQNNYSRELFDSEQTVIVLENDYLRATFFPSLGGKLHSLYDKIEGKELLFSNSVLRPCHLAIRSAWMSGGVEWNCGYIGHHAFTCSPIHTAKTRLDDGTPVLRFYQYERIRSIVYQMDFFLPEGSKLLFVRTRIVNPSFEVTPMYWWSNIAIPDREGNRVIVPATTTFTAREGLPVKIGVPMHNGIDVTYPAKNPIAIDYFWNVPEDERKYICQVDKGGYGLVQTSTKRLRGRKLFVWGNSQGGDRWKGFLTKDGESGSYNEIQAGLAQTQYECLPMPPMTAWEWVEAYGAIRLNPENAHGTWEEARRESACRLNEIITAEALEKLLADTEKMAKSPAEETIFAADGWGALEQKRRELAGEERLCTHLDFGALTDEQLPWLSLLERGTLGKHDPKEPPISYICGREWTKRLREATEGKDADNWFTWLQLGLCTLAVEDYEGAERMLNRSLDLCRSPWALYALSIVRRELGDSDRTLEYMLAALEMNKNDVSIAKEAMQMLYWNERFAELEKAYLSLPDEVQKIPRCTVYYAFALISKGDIEGAEAILYKDGGFILPDIHEGETITLDLWIEIEKKKAQRDGTSFDEKNIDPPRFVDFRMFSNADWFDGGEIIRE